MTNNGVTPVFMPVLSASPNFSIFKGCDDFPRYPHVHYIADDSTPKQLKRKLLTALGSLSVHDKESALLIQFWAGTGAGKDVFLLSTTNQPYGVSGNDGKLDLFRESCLQQKFYIDLAKGVSYGFPGLVFKTETRQQTQDMNLYNPEDVRPRFGSNAIFPVQWGSFAVPVFLYTEGRTKTPSTCSTAKKKECVGVLELITTKSMTSYEADMDLVEKALEQAGFPSSAKTDGSTQDSSKKDARIETIEKKWSAAFDSSTMTAIDAPSSYKKQQKTGKRKLEHTAEIDTSTEATSSKKKGRVTQRIYYSIYSCVALCFGLKKSDAMKNIQILLDLERPIKEGTFDSVVREVGIFTWPCIPGNKTSASTSTLPETLINSRAPEIMLHNKRWGKQVVQEQLTSSDSFRIRCLNGAPADMTPNMASSSLVNPVNMPNTITQLALNNHLVMTSGDPVLGTSSDSFHMPYCGGAPANPTPNLASSSLIKLRAPKIVPNTTWQESVPEQLTSSGFNCSYKTRINPIVSEIPTGQGPTENAHVIHNTDERKPGRDFDAMEHQYDDVQCMSPIYTEYQVMPDLAGTHMVMQSGEPVLGTSSDSFRIRYVNGALPHTTPNMASSSLVNPVNMPNTITQLALNNHLVMTSGDPVLGTSSDSFHMPYCGGAPANPTPNLASSSLIKLRAPKIVQNTTWHEQVPEQLTSSGFDSSYKTRINPTVFEIPTGLEATENAHVIPNTDGRQPERDSDALENQYDDVQYMGPIYTEDQVISDLAGTQTNETLDNDIAEFLKTFISPTSSGIPTENANLIHDTYERQLRRDFNVNGNQHDDAQLTGLNYTGDEVMSDRVGAPVNEIADFDSYSETPSTVWASNTMAQEEVTSHDSIQTLYVHSPGDCYSPE